MKKLFIWALTFTMDMATDMIWICWSSCTNCVSHISMRNGCKDRSVCLRLAYTSANDTCVRISSLFVTKRAYLRPVHTGSKVLSPYSLEVIPCNLNHWEHGNWDLPLHMDSQVLSPKHDTNAYMATLFGDEAWDLCWDLDRAKSQTQLSTQDQQVCLHKIIKIQFRMNIKHILMIPWYSKVGNIASKLRLANMSATWDPCEPALKYWGVWIDFKKCTNQFHQSSSSGYHRQEYWIEAL